MTKHTPGPWFTKLYKDPERWCVRQKFFVICNLVENDKETEANARLIAKAPETKAERDALLEALERLLSVLHDNKETLTIDVQIVAQKTGALIAKVKGE